MRKYMQRIIVSLVVLGGVAAVFVTMSTALFTDSDPVGSNSFNTGTLVLNTSPTSAVWTAVTNGAPGDRATGSLTVSNAGTLDLRYALTGANTNATLAVGENLRVALRGGASCDFPFHNIDGTNTTLTDDTQVFSGTLNTATLVGSNATGAQAGDRTLAAAANEILCFAVVLPTSATNALQGLANTTTFTFDSEQTSNNP
jgi:predicted ribosomally synthesized peptide with SipW-like signal peptide